MKLRLRVGLFRDEFALLTFKANFVLKKITRDDSSVMITVSDCTALITGCWLSEVDNFYFHMIENYNSGNENNSTRLSQYDFVSVDNTFK